MWGRSTSWGGGDAGLDQGEPGPAPQSGRAAGCAGRSWPRGRGDGGRRCGAHRRRRHRHRAGGRQG